MAVTAPTPPLAVEDDRAPDWVAGGTPEPLKGDLELLVGEPQVLSRALDLVRYASDASPYRLFPQAVVLARTPQDVAAVFAYGRRTGTPVTLRAGGTSLNGQGQGSGILVDVRRHWAGVGIEDGGGRVRVRPGTILGRVNRALASRQRRIGPDPASSSFATLGGVIANNSGGMRCGTAADTYQTLRSLTFVLPSGTIVDTAAPDAVARFAAAEPELAAGLAEIRDEIRADAELSARIRSKFEIKNTTGLRLCAFLDEDEPVQIFRRLLVGSEGTLAFVAEAVLDTVPHGRHTSTGIIFFPSVDAAAEPVPRLVEAGASAVELMVNLSLIAASWSLPGMPEKWRALPPEGAILLVELRTDDEAALDGLEERALGALAGCELLEPPELTRDRHETETFWVMREGMQGVVGHAREQGAALIIEDVCVPPARIAESARDIQALLAEHGFLTGVAGHASAGNLHFLLTPKFAEASERERYEAFMEGLVELVVDKYDGSLKAEHGTGRNMAPYIEREWGAKATELMWRVKALADPDGVLNPDVMFSRDAGVHLRALKTTPPIEDVASANTCIECGFCEPVCPSRDLTTTPRQRIVLRREMARQPAGSPVLAALVDQFAYDGLETCAADGSCKLACPVGIDTGALVKDVRRREVSPRLDALAARGASAYALVERAARLGLRAGPLAARVRPARAAALPAPAPGSLPVTERTGAAAVYLPSCLNRMFGVSRADGDAAWLVAALVAVSARAGSPVWIPGDVAGVCCAMPWSSKGLQAGHATMSARLVDSARRWTEDGARPLVLDASSCAHSAAGELAEAGVEVLDAVAWAARLLPSLTVSRPAPSVTAHPTCGTRHLGGAGTLERVAAFCSASGTADVPIVATCCGMAGDRGFLFPELTASATKDEAREVRAGRYAAHVSSNRTCEIALERATDRPYESVVQLLERVTRP